MTHFWFKLVQVLETIAKVFISCVIGFALWYFIGAFIANNSNILEWTAFGKIVYLLLAIGTAAEVKSRLN